MPPSLQKLAVVMVGLPARGKTYTARKIARYLRWQGLDARVFNVGNYRRELLGPQQPHGFFDPGNPDGLDARRRMAVAALDDLVSWFQRGGDVGIYDATNSTRARRRFVRERLEAAGVPVLFVESVCDDPAVIESNIRETKLRSPDYAGVDPDAAVRDFRARIAHYERAYEPVQDDEGSSVQLIDVGRRLVLNEIRGYLPGRLVFFLMNLHVIPRRIWLSRHGESQNNVLGRIGGDTALSPRGRDYATRLAAFVRERAGDDLRVISSTLARTVETADALGGDTEPWRALDELDAGLCDGLTYEEIAERYPVDAADRKADKLRYRYPRGESYVDVIQRVEPVILELERTRGPVLVVAHQATIRALYAYFAGRSAEEIPHLAVPLHTVIELTPRAYGCDEARYPLGPEPDAPPSARDSS